MQSDPNILFTWEAMYSDGTMFAREEGDVIHKVTEIDESRLVSFCLRPTRGIGGIVIEWKPGYKLVYFYRNLMLNVGSANEKFLRIYCVGYEYNEVKTLFVILPNGIIVVTDDIDKIQVGCE